MIAFFGPAGVGKSIQGQMLAARHGWRWLSAGNLLRESNDPKVREFLAAGELVPTEITDRVIWSVADQAHEKNIHIILDGYPRSLEQAQNLTAHEQSRIGRNGIHIAIVLEAPAEEIFKRLAIRGRADDKKDAIERRLAIFAKNTAPILDYYRELGVPVAKINGVGTVGEVHDRIERALAENKVVADEF
jgi:adenylate kinase